MLEVNCKSCKKTFWIDDSEPYSIPYLTCCYCDITGEIIVVEE
jgi:hypothetical protein